MLLPQRSAGAQARTRLLLSVVFAVIALLIAYIAATYRMIAREAQLDETRHADVIVVFGAAEYSGKPSPVYRARLDHAADLFRQGIAPIIITTGGAGRDPNFSEGQVGRSYLTARGIPEGQLIAETQSDDTLQSAERVAAIMRANGMHTCVTVSDGYHMFRIKRMMQAQGIDVYAAPRSDAHGSSPLAMLDEVFKYTLWKLRLE